MDFFEAQALAKKRTSRLVTLFVLGVIGTILVGYFGAVVAGRIYGDYSSQRSYRVRTRSSYYAVEPTRGTVTVSSASWWQPEVFAGVSILTIVVVGLASLYKWSELSAGGSAVAESVGGRRLDPNTTDTAERRLLNVVEEMAIASGVPVPAVYLLDDEPGINAFAAGLTTSDAVVTVTRGALDKLTREELQGVIGHEFSHILNGDMRLNTRLAAVLFGILVIGLAGRGLLWSLRFSNIRSSRDDRGGGNGLVLAMAFLGLLLLVVGYAGYFFGRLIQAAISRQREFLADASSVQFTRNPGGLANALRKIGGYALGSRLQTSKAAAISHFFFAQSFESAFTGLWATHPPLDERIRAIDPKFDGSMIEPPQVVDVARQSWADAGFSRGAVNSAGTPLPIPPVPSRSINPAAAIANIGALTEDHFRRAQAMLDAVPAPLREAARDPAVAPAVVCGLLIDGPPEVRARQEQIVATRGGADATDVLNRLRPYFAQLDPIARLPLLQLCIPALRQLDPATVERFAGALDELVHADGVVTPFEFALQKILLRSLLLGRDPSAGFPRYQSFNALIPEISAALSVLAHTSSPDPAAAGAAFALGAAQLKLIERNLTFFPRESADFATLDAALDKLAQSTLPIKQRVLVAAAYVVGADGQILIAEAELLRAFSAALDCPMPPLG